MNGAPNPQGSGLFRVSTTPIAVCYYSLMDEVELMIAAATAAKLHDPRPETFAGKTWVTLTEDGDTWRECPKCGEPEDECCVWCGCVCNALPNYEVAHDQPCISMASYKDFIREYAD